MNSVPKNDPKAIVLRHGHCDLWHDNLSDMGRKNSIQRWQTIIGSLGISVKASDILLVSSSAPRALQTMQSIRQGMWLSADHPIYETSHLWDGDKHYGNVQKVLDFISTLPPALFLIVVTHADFIDQCARWLGYDGEEIRNPSHLDGTGLFPREIFRERFTKTMQIHVNQDNLHEIYMKMRDLRESSGSWGVIRDETGNIHRFFIPAIRNLIGWNPYDESQDTPKVWEIMITYPLRPEIYRPSSKIKDFPEISFESAIRLTFREFPEAEITYQDTTE